MISNPILGVLFHWVGGLASASFYVPYRGVRNWAWETYWLAGGVFSWLFVPLAIGSYMTRDLFAVLREAPGNTIFWCYMFGVLWGFGGLTFGLTMRYLGLSLGMALALGYCAAFGTLAPPIFRGEFVNQVLGTRSGQIILVGVAVCLCGIVVAGMAGIAKERATSAADKQKTIAEFNLKTGLLVATFCGVMSACFSYGLAAGEPIRAITLRHGTPYIWQGLPVLVVVLWGGLTTNLVWCLSLNIRNKTGFQYLGAESARTAVARPDSGGRSAPIPLLRNYVLSATAGTIWYFQFFFYTMGETQMGKYRFSSWTLHMASIMIFGAIWGIALHEWEGAGGRAFKLLTVSIAVLVASTVIVGYGNYVGSFARAGK